MTRTPDQTLACLIIDDPLLRSSYGCIDFEQLLAKMKRHSFFTEIAFIPSNWRRSDPRTVRPFAENPDYFGVCVHGCDHLGNEFGEGTFEHLDGLAATSLERMEAHRTLTGLDHDRVMVFPRGKFSTHAMHALKVNGYLAAFNSTLRSTDGGEPDPGDYALPATTTYHGVPLFLRRDLHERAALRQDIRCGRPALLVAHHGDFFDGYDFLTDTVDWINAQGNVRWTSLGEITRRYCDGVTTTDGSTAIQTPAPARAPAHCLDISLKAKWRRFQSEFRDNHIETNGLLRKLYSMRHRIFKRSRVRQPVFSFD